MKLNITCIPGDGIGPEIVNEAKKVLNRVAEKFGHEMNYTDILMGGASIDVHGVPLTDEAIAAAKAADAEDAEPAKKAPAKKKADADKAEKKPAAKKAPAKKKADADKAE